MLATGGGTKGGQSQPAGIGVSGIAAEEIISVLPAGEQPSASHCGRKSGVRTKGNPSVHLHTDTSPQTPHLHAAAHGHKPIVSSSLNTSPTPMCPSVSPTQHTLVPHCVSAPRLPQLWAAALEAHTSCYSTYTCGVFLTYLFHKGIIHLLPKKSTNFFPDFCHEQKNECKSSPAAH